MFEAVTSRSQDQDIIIKAAAVADYRPAQIADEKLKKSGSDMILTFTRTDDILAFLGNHKQNGQFLCGFAMETEHLIEHAKAKLEKKNLDMIVANNLKEAGAGFGTDTNIITLITKDKTKELQLLTKDEAAKELIDEILRLRTSDC